MRISEITLSNFRCFGPDPTTIAIGDLTSFVGTNAAGKTALLQSLYKLFGRSGSDRDLAREDFHVPRAEGTARPSERALSITVRIDFPELKNTTASTNAIAECFRQMIVSQPGQTPFCLVRLKGTWTQGSVPEGVVEQQIEWVKPGATAAEEKTHAMRAVDRSRIQVHYVPAVRDPLRQIRQVSGSVIARLFKSVKWSESVQGNIAKATETIKSLFGGEAGVKAIEKALVDNWKTVHDSAAHSSISIRPVSKDFDDILRRVEAVFSPSPGGEEVPLDLLSDGQRSLFYFAIVAAAFDIDGLVLEATDDKVFDRDILDPPSLTILAVEEPENHVAPHYLGRIMDVLRKMASSPRAQVLITSHSPSILHRVEPSDVRHVRLEPKTRTSLVRPIDLPTTTDEAYKFVREAVRAYPELYFARFVILGEGDSEEIVLPRIAESAGVRIDQSFVSIVPLGGRHVNHFWRLLNSLNIPHVTLLDLDRERHGGGWGRIKYALQQLLTIGVPREKLLALSDKSILPDESLATMHTWASDVETMQGWIAFLEEYGVYFAAPLDLDFLMLRCYPGAYTALEGGERGPNIPKDSDKGGDADRLVAVQAVLKDAGGKGETYTTEERKAFFWYRYLFLGRGKPSTHIRALSQLDDASLRASHPPVLSRLMKKMNTALKAGA